MSDFLQEAIQQFTAAVDAFDRAEDATSERTAAAALRVSERRERTAQTLALLSLESVVESDSDRVVWSAVRIFGS